MPFAHTPGAPSVASDGRLFACPAEPAAEPVPQHPYWEATGAVTYRDPDGREVVFAPFVFGVNEPAGSADSGRHEFPPR